LKKIYLFIFIGLITSVGYSQHSITHIQKYLKKNIPVGWHIEQRGDSIIYLGKLVHWDDRLDPVPESMGYDDTMSVIIYFHPYQDETAKAGHLLALSHLNEQVQALTDQRKSSNDTLFKGKKGFYDYMERLRMLTTLQHTVEYTYFQTCSITFSYWMLYNPLISYDRTIDKEVESIKNTLISYLQKKG
jgi:hypothetical protein